MVTFHASFDTDNAAEKFAHSILLTVRSHGGDIHVSRSFGNGPAVVVLSLPENIEVKAVTDQAFTPVEPAVAAEPVAQPAQADATGTAQTDATDNWGGEFDL